MNILLDFTAFNCDQGHANECTRTACKICGQSFEMDAYESDPKVELRKGKLKPVFDKINENKDKLKKLKRDLINEIITKKTCESEREVFLENNRILLNKINSKLFHDLDLTSDSIKENEDDINNKIDNICKFFEDLYAVIYKLHLINTKYIWKNVMRRHLRITILMIDTYSHFLTSAIVNTFEKAENLQNEGQEMFGHLSMEIEIINSIFESENVSADFDIFENGKLNFSASIATMVAGSIEGSNSEGYLAKTRKQTHYYFRKLLTKGVNAYNDAEILWLTSFKYVGISVFDDDRYLKKINISLKMMNKAYEKNPIQMKRFLFEYSNKYLYMIKKLIDLSQSFAFVYGNEASELIIMQNAITWYKIICEGLYRDSSLILVYCCEVMSNSNKNIDDILEWTNFADIYGRFESLKKYNLNILTEGIQKIVRNAEAHVDFDIDEKSKRIFFRSKQRRSRGIKKIEYDFEEFFDVINLLSETVYSIIASTNIFLFNTTEFEDLKNELIEKVALINKANELEIFAPLKGVIITGKEHKIIDGYKHLNINGTYYTDGFNNNTPRELLSVIFFAVRSFPEYQKIVLLLHDLNDNKLCEIKADTEYYKQFITGVKHPQYLFLLMWATANIKKDTDDSEKMEIDDCKFLYSAFVLLLEKFAKLNNITILKTNYAQGIISYIQILDELQYVIVILNEYMSCVDDKRLLRHGIDIVSNIISSINSIIERGKFDNGLHYWFGKFNVEVNRMVEVADLHFGKIDKESFLRTKTREGIELYKNISRNDPCLCGSGKKYKKCCGK